MDVAWRAIASTPFSTSSIIDKLCVITVTITVVILGCWLWRNTQTEQGEVARAYDPGPSQSIQGNDIPIEVPAIDTQSTPVLLDFSQVLRRRSITASQASGLGNGKEVLLVSFTVECVGSCFQDTKLSGVEAMSVCRWERPQCLRPGIRISMGDHPITNSPKETGHTSVSAT